MHISGQAIYFSRFSHHCQTQSSPFLSNERVCASAMLLMLLVLLLFLPPGGGAFPGRWSVAAGQLSWIQLGTSGFYFLLLWL